MCSTIRPCLVAHCFSFLQARPFRKGQTEKSHAAFILGYFLLAARRPRGAKRAKLSAPVQGPTFVVSCK